MTTTCLTPASTAASTRLPAEASRPAPFAIRTLAPVTISRSRSDASYEWGSAPAGTSAVTGAPHATWEVMSAHTVVVATIWAVAASSAEEHAVAVTPISDSPAAMAVRRWRCPMHRPRLGDTGMRTIPSRVG